VAKNVILPRAAALAVLTGVGLWGQTTAGATFEAVTVKPSSPNDGRYVRGCKGGPGTGDPTFWRCTNATITMLVEQGYHLRRYQLSAPDWTASENFEIEARLAPDSTQDQLREMIRGLLGDSFRLRFHWGKKEMPQYDLVVANGRAKLKASADQAPEERQQVPRAYGGDGAADDAGGYPNIPRSCSGCMAINAAGKARYRAARAQIKNLTAFLDGQLGRQVNDLTGLTGWYDITLSWTSGGGIGPRPDSDADPDAGLTIESAVQQQLGLKLVPRKGPVDVFIVDQAEKKPAGN
jgi:uncharacterized protein (TIGR03435 family)